MGLIGRLFAGSDTAFDHAAVDRAPTRTSAGVAPQDDARSIERYRFFLRTAPLEIIEQVHADAFGELTDDQRAMIYEELSQGAGTGERPLSSEPATLARAASRAESRRPGSILSVLSDPALVGTVAVHVVGSALASAFLPWNARSETARPSRS